MKIFVPSRSYTRGRALFPNCFWTDLIIFTSSGHTVVTYGLVERGNQLDHPLILEIRQKWPGCAADDKVSGGDDSVLIRMDNFNSLDMMGFKNKSVAGTRSPS